MHGQTLLLSAHLAFLGSWAKNIVLGLCGERQGKRAIYSPWPVRDPSPAVPGAAQGQGRSRGTSPSGRRAWRLQGPPLQRCRRGLPLSFLPFFR